MKKHCLFIAAALLAVFCLTPGVGAADAVTTTPAGTEVTSSPLSPTETAGTVGTPATLPSPSDTPTSAEPSPASVTPAVSPALAIIAADSGMAKAGLAGEKLVFSHADFCRALNLKTVPSVTVTSLPDPSAGRLLLGTTVVSVGQTIAKQSLDLLVFSPASDVKTCAEFGFTAGDGDYPLTCSVFMLDGVNASPVAAVMGSRGVCLETFRDTVGYGKLPAYDPEDDELTFEVVSRPAHGIVVMNDRHSGDYVYLPAGSFKGTDEFSYVVRDCYGNYSAAATVSVTVSESARSVGYTDMKGNPASSAALLLAEKEIMTGNTAPDGKTVFDPTGSVSRADFTVMALGAAGITDLPDTATVFADNSDIPAAARRYVSAAYSLGLVDGSERDEGLVFAPDEKITLSEAAQIADGIIGTDKLLGDYSGTTLYNLELLGAVRRNAKPSEALTRADAATLLAAVMKYK